MADFPLRSDVRTRVGARTYGQSSTLAFDGSLVAALREVSDVGESAGFVVGSYSKQVFPFRNEGEARLGAQRRTWKVATKWRTEMEPAEWRLRRWAPVRRWERRKGETKSKVLGWNGAKWNEGEALLSFGSGRREAEKYFS